MCADSAAGVLPAGRLFHLGGNDLLHYGVARGGHNNYNGFAMLGCTNAGAAPYL